LLASDVVSYVEEDQTRNIIDCQSESNPAWGLARTNVRDYNVSKTYTYDYSTGSTGAGVDAYVIDTGIYCENNDFVNKKVGSCTFGYSSVTNFFGVVDETDGNGHGTHVSGTIAGQTYGVAKEADLIAVKVMSDRGSGSSSNILSGIDWVISNVKKTKKPSVANLSIGGGFSQTENDAIQSATDAGITMVVAAGNDDSDACEYSPASAASAITVGATGDDNARAYYSNYGKCLDVFGPGTDITSTWIDAVDATNTISGTSMASPHVCGVAAKILSQNPTFTVAQVTAQMLSDATKDVVTDVQNSANLMVYAACDA
jgi:serine protease